jgi:hypothetical protein
MNQNLNLSSDANKLLQHLSDKSKTRDALIHQLEWGWEKYFSAESELRGYELLDIRRGKGGGVRRLIPEDLEHALTGLPESAKLLARTLPNTGEPMSTIALRRQLENESVDIPKALEVLQGKGIILRPEDSRSIRLTSKYIDVSHTIEDQGDVEQVSKLEKTLYEGFGRKLLRWAKDGQGYETDEIVLEQTAFKGRKKSLGKWTRPDYTLVTIMNYSIIPGKHIQILTFEVKTSNNWNVEAVFEAASHSRGATESYLAIHRFIIDDDKSRRVLDECRRFGIGLLTFEDDETTPLNILLEARNSPIHPENCNDFLENILNTENLKDIKEKFTINIRALY